MGKGPKFTRPIVWLWLLAALLATVLVRCDPRGNGTLLRESQREPSTATPAMLTSEGAGEDVPIELVE